jgi:dipeptidase E
MNLFLASNAFQTLDLLVPKLGRDPRDMKVAFVPTASELDVNPWWQVKDRKKLEELGFAVTELKLDHKLAPDMLTSFDAIFVAGGNTFYLLQKAYESGFLELARARVEQGAWYIGSSAGSVLAGPDIGPVHFVDNAEDAPALASTRALGFIAEVIIPHANLKDREEGIDSCIAECHKLGFKPLAIHDQQAVLIQGRKQEILTA